MQEAEIQGRIRWSSVRIFILSALKQRTRLSMGLCALAIAALSWSVVTQLSGHLADRILEVGATGSSIYSDWLLAVYFCGVLLCLLIMYLGNRYGRMFINETLIRALTDLHDRALSAVLAAPLSFFNQNPSGRIVARFSNDFQNASQSLDRTMATFIYAILAILFSAIAILNAQPLVLLFASPFAFGIYFASRFFGQRARDKQRSAGRAQAAVMAQLNEVGNIGIAVRALRLDEKISLRMERLQSDAAQLALDTLELSNLRSLVQSLLALAVISIALVASANAHSKGQLTVGQAGAVVTLLMVILRNFVLVIELVNTVELGFVSIERMNEYTQLVSEDAMHAERQTLKSQAKSVALLRFDNVSVRYDTNEPPILNNFSAEILSRQMVGIVGRTGAGKSTLISALLRFVPLESGTITLQGLTLSELPAKTARQNIALVPQDPILFVGSLLKNVMPNATADDLQARSLASDVLATVGLSDWLAQLPHGLETQILERGMNLSQGQRQLVCLARALAQSPKLLVLDEATSAVDLETERLVSQALQKIRSTIPILLIAHRPQTIQSCDQVWLLKNGQLAWSGFPLDLPRGEMVE